MPDARPGLAAGDRLALGQIRGVTRTLEQRAFLERNHQTIASSAQDVILNTFPYQTM